MKVIMLQDIKNVGRMGEVKTFPDGYVQNFLLPKKLAEIATDAKVKKIENDKNYKVGEKEIQKDLLIKDISKVDAQTITINKKVNSSGGLFEKIHEKQIAEYIKDNLHVRIPEQYIHMSEPIHSTGEFFIHVGDYKTLKKESLLTIVVKGQ
jgi:large subunit ribosomal protein L9